jgi:RHS repeat-associated protein
VYYLYDLAGHVITELNPSGGWNRGEVYAGGGHVATYADGKTYFSHGDWLGTERARTDGSGAMVETCQGLPFGDELNCSGGDVSPLHFTGKQRDSESGLDYFGARYSASSLGRFMTPDSPSYANHKNPQTWNLYAYSLDNPVTFRDADGHTVACANDPQQCLADARTSTANAQAAARITLRKIKTRHSFLGLFHFTTTQTQIAIKGDINSFRALSSNASKLADLVTGKDTITVSYGRYARPSLWARGFVLNGGSMSYTPSEGYAAQAFIDSDRTHGGVYDPDAVGQGIPQANTAEEFGHEVLGHIWRELIGGHPAGTRANMRDSIVGENAVRALDPTRSQKGLESHHNYYEMPPDPKQ